MEEEVRTKKWDRTCGRMFPQKCHQAKVSLIKSVHIDFDASEMYRMRRTGVSVSILYVLGPHDFIRARESCILINNKKYILSR